ncbi:hypothetical protein B0T10DRAFT_606253 [Thelonectria olida]|uniref:Uncharacterized protein n=1 Tax=Thelonectria olida TaxID=1576542 RepID=A0A9P9AM38_9HYPO|nr:hypothetical protein B0T10DRAFT_606253 [Thelonectria olida]
MKRCTAVHAGRLPSTGFGVQIQPRRWRSYDKSTLTQDALLEQVESQLGDDVNGKPLRVNPDAKTVTTAAGALPISPIMDPAWIKTMRREKKNNPGKISGQFRKKLSNNPFAQALITPLRWCSNTDALLPRYFLQDLEVVSHPEHPNQQWLAPGPISLNVVPSSRPRPRASPTQTQPIPTMADSDTLEGSTSDEHGNSSKANELDIGSETSTRRDIRTQAPLTSYCLSRKSLVDSIFSQSKASRRSKMLMFARRSGMAATTFNRKDSIWHPDMGDLILKRQRRMLVEALIYRAERNVEPDYRFLQPVNSWDEVKDVEKRGCVLWFGDTVNPKTDAFATLDVKDAKWWKKIPVHNLAWLLGEEGVKVLRESSTIFRDNNIVVLKLWRIESVRRLHLLLWRMHGYLVEDE